MKLGPVFAYSLGGLLLALLSVFLLSLDARAPTDGGDARIDPAFAPRTAPVR